MSHRGVYTKRYGLGSHLSLNLDTYDVCVQPAYAVAPHVDDTTVLDGIRDVADEHVYAEARTRFERELAGYGLGPGRPPAR